MVNKEGRKLDSFLREFIIRQMNIGDEKRIAKADLFLRFLDVICQHSQTGSDFKIVRSKLEEIAKRDCLEFDAIGQAVHIESFIKELYYVKFGKGAESFPEAIIGCKLFESKYIRVDGKTLNIGTNDESQNRPSYYKKLFPDNSSGRHFAGMYRCRNTEAHNLRTLPLDIRTELFLNVLHSFLESTWINQDEVRMYIMVWEFHLSEYFDMLKRRYKKEKTYNAYIPPKGIVRRFGKKIADDKSSDVFDFYNECQKRKRMRLIGKAGMGKTTTIRELIQYDIQNFEVKHRIPVLIELINITDRTVPLVERIANILETDVEKVKNLLERGFLNVYLDGINEIVMERADLRNVIHQIDKFIGEYTSTFMLLSDRENNYMGIMNDEPTYYVLPMNEEQIDDFIKKNCSSAQYSEAGMALHRLLATYPSIRECARTPYMLSQLIDIAKNCPEDLPHDHNDITECLLEAIFRREIKEKKAHLAKYAKDFLSSFAANMPEIENGYLRVDEAKKIIVRVIEDKVLGISRQEADDTLKLLIQIGILQEQDGRITFSQPDFKDYYFYEAFKDVD